MKRCPRRTLESSRWDSSGTHVASLPNKNPRFTGVLGADDGARTHDLLHGKSWRAFAPVRSGSLKPPFAATPRGASERKRSRANAECSHCSHCDPWHVRRLFGAVRLALKSLEGGATRHLVARRRRPGTGRPARYTTAGATRLPTPRRSSPVAPRAPDRPRPPRRHWRNRSANTA